MMTKKSSILAALRAHSLNRFEAERLGDHCLPTTIAELRSDGFVIHDEWEEVPTRFNKTCRVKRYRLVGVQ